MLDQFLQRRSWKQVASRFAQSMTGPSASAEALRSDVIDPPSNFHNFAAADSCESKQVRVTTLSHRGGSSDQSKVFSQNNFADSAPDALS